jgi:hypothetical protein
MCGAEFFRQRPNSLGDLAKNFGQELATLTYRESTTKKCLKLLLKMVILKKFCVITSFILMKMMYEFCIDINFLFHN